MEIILRKNSVCNLTEVNVMGFVDEDGNLDIESLLSAQKMSGRAGYRMASIDFELHDWDITNKEDMLTGCSLTGWQDMVNATNMSIEEQASLLQKLKKASEDGANELADLLGTNKPKLYNTIKPSGTLSQLPTVSNGIHWNHSPYYRRHVRINAHDPLALVAKELGWKWHPEVGQTEENMDTMVIEFYVQAPDGKTKYDVSAIEQLEQYKLFMQNYADHNVSITVHVREHEWDLVEEWCYENWNDLVAVSFLSLDDSFYQLMPYEKITKEEYEASISKQSKFNPLLLLKYETSEDSEIDAECAEGHCPTR
jgi:ribonucleoside-diphosphate reductase alpha chain/ribonucleoside-triphosphate reductase